MRAHVLHHEPFETIGNIGAWLEARAAHVTETHLYDPAHRLPAHGAFDLLIVMGGTMSVTHEATLPWLKPEKVFLRETIARGTPVLGICLGSQLIASALGARVRDNRHPEFGWLELQAVPGARDCFQFPERFTTFQSHEETYDLPPGATHLVRSEACEHQAFQVGERTIAMQFHLESTPESAGAIAEECATEFSGPYVQSHAAACGAPPELYAQSAALMNQVLSYITR